MVTEGANCEKGPLTVVCVSDIHGLYNRNDILKIPEGDVLVVAGDIELTDVHAAKRFDNWLANLPHKHKVVTFGNMDSWAAEHPNNPAQLEHAQVACDNVLDIEGYKFVGSPWTPKFYGVFQFDDEESAAEHWQALLPPDAEVDVLVTHGPPKGYGDTTKGRQVGDAALLEAVQALNKPPKLWICGHIHESCGVYQVPHLKTKETITLVNAASYYITQGRAAALPKVVELPSCNIITCV